MESAGKSLTAGVTLPILAVAAGAVKAAADFEESFSGIAKTVDGVANSKGELTAFGKELSMQMREIAKTVPISVNELNKIGEAAGAMGIPKERIADFTKTIAMLAATTDLTSDQAAMSVGKIQGIYGTLGQDTERFASSLVALGNAGKSFESTIVRAAERMSATGMQAEISQDQLLGWASAIADISPGGNIELTTTAWNKLVSVMDKAVALGGGKLDQFAKVASMSGTQFSASSFQEAFKQDSSGALLAFVQGLGQVEAKGGNVTKVLEDMGLKTSGVQMTLKALAATSGEVARQLALSRDEWQKGTAMQEEFTKKSATTISQLKILFNQLYDVGISLGQQLIPALMNMRPAAEGALQVIAGLVISFSNLPEPLQLTVFGFFGLVAAVGPALIILSKIPQAFTAISTAIGLASSTMAGWTLAIAGLAFAVPKAVQAISNLYDIWSKFGTKALIGELGRNVNDDNLSFFKDWRVDQMPQRRRGGFSRGQTLTESPGFLAPGAALARVKDELKNFSSGLTDLSGDTGDGGLKKANQSLEKFGKWMDDHRPRVQNGLPSNLPGQLPMPIPIIPAIMPRLTGSMFDKDGMMSGLSQMPGIQLPMPEPPKAGADPDFFRRAFGGDFGKTLGQTVMQALTGGGDLLKSVGGLGLSKIGESIVAGFSESFGKSFLGKMLGGILPGLGAAIGPLIDGVKGLFNKLFGNAGRDLVKDFAASKGGFDALRSELTKLGAEGEKLWVNLTQGVGRNNPEQAKAAIEAVTAALEARVKGIETFAQGAALRIQSFTDAFKTPDKTFDNGTTVPGWMNALGGDQSTVQQEFALMGMYAGTAFSTTLREFGLARAIADAGPLFDQLLGISQEFGFQLEGSAAQFAAFYQTAQANQPVIQALEGLTLMIKGAGDAAFLDQQLFNAFGLDAVTQFTRLTESGVAANQALIFMQPTLQALFEAQTKFGLVTDDATQALIEQGIQQGIVGYQMKDVNKQILDVLVAIGDALGAKIPDALRGLPPAAQAAADGMNAAFSRVQPPNIDSGVWSWRADGAGIEAPEMARGGYVPARSGGTLVRLGEGGEGEYVVPESKVGGGSGNATFIFEIDGERFARGMAPYIAGEAQRLGVS